MKVAAADPPNIANCYGTCRLEGGRLGLVLELFESDLLQHIASPLPIPEARLILKQVALGLRHLRELNIVHRDIKPDNVLVNTVSDGTIRVALTDLGVSKHMTRTQRSNQTDTGTDLWMAPEVKGDSPTYGHPADVYGFGLTALWLVTGNFPMGRTVQPKELEQWIDECLRDAEVSDPDFRSLVKECLEYDPARRTRKESLIDHGFLSAPGAIQMTNRNANKNEWKTKLLMWVTRVSLGLVFSFFLIGITRQYTIDNYRPPTDHLLNFYLWLSYLSNLLFVYAL